LLRTADKSYPAYPLLISRYTSAATPSARLASLLALSTADLLAAHIETYKWGGVSLTLEDGPKAIWTKSTLERITEGDWDKSIEGVVLGTNEDEGSLFAWGMKVSTAVYSVVLCDVGVY
jgi:hypothetical protein